MHIGYAVKTNLVSLVWHGQGMFQELIILDSHIEIQPWIGLELRYKAGDPGPRELTRLDRCVDAVRTDQAGLGWAIGCGIGANPGEDSSGGTDQTELVHRICYMGYIWELESMQAV